MDLGEEQLNIPWIPVTVSFRLLNQFTEPMIHSLLSVSVVKGLKGH